LVTVNPWQQKAKLDEVVEWKLSFFAKSFFLVYVFCDEKRLSIFGYRKIL